MSTRIKSWWSLHRIKCCSPLWCPLLHTAMEIAHLEAVWKIVIYMSLGSKFLSAEPLLLHWITCLCRQQHSDQIKFDNRGPEKRTNHLFVVIAICSQSSCCCTDKGSEACKSIITALQCWKSSWGGEKFGVFFLIIGSASWIYAALWSVTCHPLLIVKGHWNWEQ